MDYFNHLFKLSTLDYKVPVISEEEEQEIKNDVQDIVDQLKIESIEEPKPESTTEELEQTTGKEDEAKEPTSEGVNQEALLPNAVE